MIFYHRKENTTYLSLILVFVALIPLPVSAPWDYVLKIVVLFGLYIVLPKKSIDKKTLMIISGILFLLFMYFGNVFALILGKVMGYLITGTKTEGLHYYSVMQTVREAGKIPFETFANRISGSQWGLLVAAIGYVVLIIRHRAFILALPLVGIGVFAWWGGLRFTVYAVPIAAMSATYLFYVIGRQFNKKVEYTLLILGTSALIYPNIQHIISYKVPTVMSNAEVKDLARLKEIANDKDYTLAWWDYGYPIWFYSGTNTLIDGGKHNNDNFIISTILQATSSQLAVNLGRVAVEDYARYGGVVTDRLFAKEDPNILLSSLQDPHNKLLKKTRDIYLYLPYKMMKIFPTVAVFGNLDLTTGKKKRRMMFYPARVRENKNGQLTFTNGIVFDTKSGVIYLGREKAKVGLFTITNRDKNGKVTLQKQLYHVDGKYVVVYMRSYNTFIVMDKKTYNSLYVKMFILGEYDKNLFELVVSSPYSKIYKLKK
jgi:dolichyl-diphosphooligosaccharide--protein glycosyltransferase/undecaprenyl-diphosphooligosaccharide--protein glycosyltransferase